MADPLLAPLVSMLAGILVSRFAGLPPRELEGALAALAALAVFAYCKSTRRAAALCCLAALFFAGALVETTHRAGPPPELDAGPREVVVLAGCVVEPPVFSEDREQFVLELEPRARARVSLYLRPGERLPALRYGQRVEVEARVRRTRNFRNPGSFDYAGYLARQDIYWTASGRGGAVRVAAGDCGSRFRGAIYHLRAAALERLEQLYRGDSYKVAMMQAVLVGESSRLEKVWTEDFRRTGTYHALVISGLHVTVLAGVLLFLAQICFLPQGPALALTAAAGWLYALVSGWQAPVIRAAAGFTLYVVARYFYRRTRLLNLLAAVAIGFLLFDPEQMFEASFQLSFLSVAAIGALAAPALERTSAPLARGLAGLADTGRDPRMAPRAARFRVELRLIAETLWFWTRIPQRFWLAAVAALLQAVFYAYGLVVVSALVQAGLALPMAAYFHRLSVSGLTANVLIVPLMSAVVVVGFGAVLSGWHAVAVPAGWCLSAARWIANWHVRWEPNWRIPDPPFWLAAAFTAALLAVPLLRARMRLCAVGAAAILLAVIVRHPFPPKIEPGALELTAIDVGQSESLFLSFPDGKLMVLDGGGLPAFRGGRRSRLDMGEDVVSPYLWSRSIRRLDAVALSHGHEDHISGLAAVIENFRPRELWTGALPESPDWARLREHAARRGVRIVALRAGERFDYGGARVEVLAPLPGYEPGAAPRNNDSLVLRIAHGRHSFLLTGDIERAVESGLVADGAFTRSEVLKVAHHGSKTSTGTAFLERVRPVFALISVGFENSFSLPHPEMLARLAGYHAVALRTDEWGSVTVRSDGSRLRLQTMRWAGEPRRLYSAF